MWLTEKQELDLWNKVREYPRFPKRGGRKLAPELGFVTLYEEAHYYTPNIRYAVEIWCVDRKNGAKWVKAKTWSREYRQGVKLIKALLDMIALRQMVGSTL